uniref:G_PROTEIN_RECEP_F1_2 domain-containing protein n=1 Tax=Caenorhabditis tropicalis TaxID=1561998 RepID=A0A1I7TN81_9PELO
MAFLTQIRQVSNLTPVELWSYGPCRHFEAFICYIMYHVLQTSAMISSLSAFLTIYMKYDASQYVLPSNKRVFRVIMVMSSLVAISVSCEITLVIIQSLPFEIREKYRLLNQDTTEHSHFGIVDLNVIPSRINNIIMTVQVFALPILTFYLRRKIFSKVGWIKDDRHSVAKRAQNRLFLNGLTIQVVLPVLALVPVFVVQVLIAVTKIEILFHQYLIFVVPVIPTVLDPFITLYFVTPYRKQVKHWLGIDNKTQGSNQVTPSIFVVVT